jgi:hypothetical protein
MEQVKVDLRECTKDFALSVVRMFSGASENDRSADSWQTGPAFRHVDWRELS